MKENPCTVSVPIADHHPLMENPQATSSHLEPSPVASDDFFPQMLPSIPESYWDLTNGEQVDGYEGLLQFAWSYDEPLDLAAPLWEQEINNGPATTYSSAPSAGAHGGAEFSRSQHQHFQQPEPVTSYYSATLAGANGGAEFSASQPQLFQQSEIFRELPPLAAYYPATSAEANDGVTRVTAPPQRVRARRGQATDPHSIAERLRRERIAEGMKALHDLVPNANKKDKASMLDEIIDHLKFMQQELKMECTRRVESADVASPLGVDFPSEERGSPPPTRETLAETEEMFLKLMDEDMESANQYLQGMGLCLIPISTASTIYTATSSSDARKFAPDKDALPSSPSMSVLMVQQAAVDTNEDTNVSQFSDKDATK